MLVADVCLGRAQVRPVGLRLEAVGLDGDEVVTDALVTGLAQEHLNRPLALVVRTLAEVVLPDSSLCVGDVHGGPVPVAERPPDAVVAVERDRELDPHRLGGLADVLDVALERELGRVHADDDQSPVAVLLRPRADIRERAEPVDAGVRPEVNEDDLAAQVRRDERRRVEPSGRAVETGQAAFGGQGSRPGMTAGAEPAHVAPPVNASGASCGTLWPLPGFARAVT